ncbi:hypothetical protein CK500_16510 [Halorubrum salipaludis]|uniref:HMA domain-containing protein n=1 Tax=Halorubrum salipaludis TaxID=2032630 RepID=A0A2A2EX70_9EURY|nr:copper ion binding protein [Halorubrum salipaludis]PAU77756.1 hypothetical protein CK500_16510 [Halorubrum salipaludis]
MTPPDDDSYDKRGEPPNRTHTHEEGSQHSHESTQHTRDVDDTSPPHGQGNVAQLSVPEMDCPSCAGKVENSVEKLDGINSIDPQVTTGTLTVSYDSEQTSATEIADRVEKAGYTIEDVDEITTKFTVPEMDCPSCAGKIEKSLDKAGVTAYKTRPTNGTVVVTYDSSEAGEAEIISAIERAGYEVTDSSSDESEGQNATEERESIWVSPRALKTWISGGFVALGLLLEFFLTGQGGVKLRMRRWISWCPCQKSNASGVVAIGST